MFQHRGITNIISAGDDGRILYSKPTIPKKKGADTQSCTEEFNISNIHLNSTENTEFPSKNITVNANFHKSIVKQVVKTKSYLFSSRDVELVSKGIYSLDVLATENDVLIAYGGSVPILRIHTLDL